MRYTSRWLCRGAAALTTLALPVLGGCQTYTGGMTLPSGQYLNHSPQYFPPDPAFPLQRERDSMIDPDGALRRGAAGPLPAAPIPAAVAPGLQPVNPGPIEAPAPVPR